MKLVAMFFLSFCGCTAAAQSAPHRSQIDVREFGALCNNQTDDSTALQNAIATGITDGQPVYVPGGTCVHKATLIMNRGAKSVRLLGTPFQSVLKYTGIGSGWLWKNGDGKGFIYDPVVFGISFVCGNVAGCAKGIEAYTLSEAVFRDVEVGQADGVFGTNWFCSACNIMDLDHLVLSADNKAAVSAVGLDCVRCSAVIIRSGDFFNFSNATLRFSGPTTHVVVDGNWFESQDTAILFDDSASGGAISADLISIINNRFLFNGAGGVAAKPGTFQNQVALRFNNSGTKPMTMTGVLFGPGNSVYCAAGLCHSATPILVSVSPTTASGTSLDLTARDNTIRGLSSGIVTSNSTKVALYLENNRSQDQGGKTLSSEVVGTATRLH
jgi:hypothetical protein